MTPDARTRILELLSAHRVMTVATARPDGWPQATTVGYVNSGLTLFFLCGRESQKAANIRNDGRVSVVIGEDERDSGPIKGLSMGGARARPVTNPEEIAKVFERLAERYPEYVGPIPLPDISRIAVIEVVPEVVSIIDHSEDFGHTELEC
jgi:nitroimidazol reductase NimA-like FMN-containing flavoprotein (pyridoxamine 5'-phosphate oxidase superfamily)